MTQLQLSFRSMTDKKQKHQTSPSGRGAKTQPHETWHGDRGPHHFCISKMFFDPMHDFAARGDENFGVNAPPNLNAHNSWTP